MPAAPPDESRAGARRLILGIGNLARGDDAAGRAVIGELRSRAPAGARLAELDGQLTDLLEAWIDVDRVTVIDASDSGLAPGTISSFDAIRQGVQCALGHSSTHGLGLSEAIELARKLGRLPRELEVHAIEGRDFRPGAALSPEVAAAVRRLARELAAELEAEAYGRNE